MTYRQNGIDFFPGPLDQNNNISEAQCLYYDKHYVITKAEVQNFVNGGPITTNIKNWPGINTVDGSHPLAPYVDVDNNGKYNPEGGDYPKYSLPSKPFSCGVNQVFGDKALWWVYNDEGNIHTETHGAAIGLEVHAQAFAYTTSDAINNCTFYDYQVINYSTSTVNKCYFGQWIDMDIGYPFDDYVGCDVTNGVGYTYNGLAVDGTGAAGQYGANPPACGCDFFRGPFADPNSKTDGIDENGVSFVDQNGRIGMAKFVYYNNDFTPQGNPTSAQAYYNYLSGFWIDGTPFTYGGSAYHGSGPVCDFMFPGTSDPLGKGTKYVPQAPWSEVTAGDPPGDRRFMQSAGPFTLLPGAVNNVTDGLVWGRASQGGNLASIPIMMDADILAQALFNNCFQITNGPDAPDLSIQEMGNSLILYLTNKPTSNNYKESYVEKDPYITVNRVDTAYHFQGYIVYQLLDSSVTESDLYNTSVARQIFQCDITDGVKQIINYTDDPTLGWIPQQMVLGKDSGITHSFVVTQDAFATGNPTLVNSRQYYFMAVAYGYNKGEVSADANNRTDGYNLPFIESRRNVKYQVAMPHFVNAENNGTQMNASYGTGVQLTRIEGQGNGGQNLQMLPQSVTAILNSGMYSSSNPTGSGGRILNPQYARNAGPIQVSVIDPLSVPAANFQISVSDSSGKARFVLTNLTNGSVIVSDTVLSVAHEQIIPSLGLAVKANHITENVPNSGAPVNGGVLSATMTFANPSQQWLTGLQDVNITTPPYGDENWIRSGSVSVTSSDPTAPFNSVFLTAGDPVDPSSYFEKTLGGTWAPFMMCAYSDAALTCTGGPAVGDLSISNSFLNQFNKNYGGNSVWANSLASIDVVITADKTKWTRCPVLEMQESPSLAQGQAAKLALRVSPSVDKNGNYYGSPNANNADASLTATTGMGWFPGYAINIETGERLNMAFGEDSGLPSENGRDMQWNPTADVWDPNTGNPLFGGKHYIYIFAHNGDATQKITSPSLNLASGPASIPRYDGGLALWQLLTAAGENGPSSSTRKYARQAFVDAMWVNIPLLNPGSTLLQTDVTVSLRWPKKFRKGFSGIYGTTLPTYSNPSGSSPIDTLVKTQNRNWPLYTFTTTDIATSTNVLAVAKNALNLINIVPNPYYAYSGYEVNQTDNRVRITNLPTTCTIRIYTLNGTLIRTFNKNDTYSFVDWNLQNQVSTPIASGMYIIDIQVPGVGEKILKWFGVIRPVDLNSY